ncbi:MAG: PAS domain S-box protein, partial [Ignavibacteriaceae bacterium]|nr:PAS domain S-box protein [Ignavibacteriaceae bacterium]
SDGVFIYIDEGKKEVDLNQLIKQRGRMFDILIQNNPESIFIYDIDTLRFLEANEAALNLYGYSHEEFLQMDLTDLYTSEDIQTLLGSSSDDSSISIFSGPYRHKKKTGESLFVEISKTKFQFNGKDSFFNIVKNVTSQLELEKKNQLFKAAFENTNDTIFITDANGFISFINKSGISLLGYTQNEIENTSFAALLKDDHRAMINTSVFIPDIKEPVTLQLDIKKYDGPFINSEVIFTPILDFTNQVESFTVLLKVLKDESLQPQEIIKEVIKEVIIEKAATGDANSPDPNFLSGVFHEILTPMNVILGFAQELTDSITNPTSEQKEASDLINQNKTKLMSTMNSVVEYSELILQKTELIYSEIPITELIEKIDKKINELLNSPDTHFSYGKISSSLTFNTDAHKFETFVSSLIKVVGRMIKEKKLYFSAFPYDDEKFIILISDNYSNCSEYLTARLKLIYTGNNDIKDIGTPKLSTYLSRILLPILGGYFIEDEKFGGGFIFPLNVSQQSGFQKVESQDLSMDELFEQEETKSIDVFDKSESV